MNPAFQKYQKTKLISMELLQCALIYPIPHRKPLSPVMKWRLTAGALPCLFFLLFCTLFLGSCRAIREPEFRAVENLRVDRLGRTASALSLDILYHNPNKTRIKLKEAYGDAWLDGTFLGTFKMDTLINIPANGEFLFPVILEVDMKKLFQNSLSALLNKEVTIKLAGRARIGKGFVFINYPIRYEGKQDLEKLLR